MADKKFNKKNKGVLLVYTGGTMGGIPSDINDPESPLISTKWEEVEKRIPCLQKLKKDFPINAYSFENPIDSSNMEPKLWIELTEVIEKYYHDYEGFVIVHGTDTMVYTGSALSFMLQNLGKPIIITGSQLPVIGQLRSDGKQNLITSILIANPKYSKIPVVPEVCIFFSDKLIRANRAAKISAHGYAGFESPNFPVLGTVGTHININENLIRKIPENGQFRVKKRLQTNVITFPVVPGIQSKDNTFFQSVMNLNGLKGVVLSTYGTGNAPTTDRFLDEIQTATQKGIVVLNVSQCIQGTVQSGLYEANATLMDRGVLSGSDITSEAALCKLMVILGDQDMSTEEINNAVQTNLAGEMQAG